MNQKTLKALKGSIVKWENIVNGTGVDESGYNCPLCKLFPKCYKCPVFEYSQPDDCNNTPYGEWLAHQRKVHDKRVRPFKIECKICERHAKAEVGFLKSLLLGL